MSTLVFGSTGLIGTALQSLWRSADQVTWSRRDDVDLAMPLDTRLLPEGVQRIIYLAQGRNFRDFPAGSLDTFGVNVAAPIHLLNAYAGRGLRQFVYASTGNVHWSRLGITVDGESMTPDFYSATKVSAENLIASWSDYVDVAVLRFYTVYGPGADSRSMVSRLQHLIATGGEIRLRGAGGDTFQPTHSLDAAVAIDAVVRHSWAGTSDVAGPEVLNVRQMVERLSASSKDVRFAVADGPSRDYASRGPLLQESLPSALPRIVFPGPEGSH